MPRFCVNRKTVDSPQARQTQNVSKIGGPEPSKLLTARASNVIFVAWHLGHCSTSSDIGLLSCGDHIEVALEGQAAKL